MGRGMSAARSRRRRRRAGCALPLSRALTRVAGANAGCAALGVDCLKRVGAQMADVFVPDSGAHDSVKIASCPLRATGNWLLVSGPTGGLHGEAVGLTVALLEV